MADNIPYYVISKVVFDKEKGIQLSDTMMQIFRIKEPDKSWSFKFAHVNATRYILKVFERALSDSKKENPVLNEWSLQYTIDDRTRSVFWTLWEGVKGDDGSLEMIRQIKL